MTALLVDIGNSRIKWTLAADAELLAPGQALAHADHPALFAAWADVSPAPSEVRCVSVASGPTLALIESWVVQHWGLALDRVQTPSSPPVAGLTLAYPQPEQLGADRWLAMRGAQNLGQLPAIIIDAGSAITIDQVDAQGQHYGGLIMAGLAAQQAGLQTITPALLPWMPDPADNLPSLLATNTADALRSGAINGTAAALDQLIARLRSDSAGQEQTPDAIGAGCNVLITGGDAPVLAAAMQTPAQYYPDLVLAGLAVSR